MKIILEYDGFTEFPENSVITKATFHRNGSYELFHENTMIHTGNLDLKVFESVYNGQYGVPPSQDGTMLFLGSWEKGIYAINVEDGSTIWHYRKSRITRVFVFEEYITGLRYCDAFLKFDIRTGKLLSRFTGCNLEHCWRIDEKNMLLNQKYNSLLLLNTETMETVRKYPNNTFNPRQCLSNTVRSAWLENGELMIEGFEEYPERNRLATGSVDFVRSLGVYKVE